MNKSDFRLQKCVRDRIEVRGIRKSKPLTKTKQKKQHTRERERERGLKQKQNKNQEKKEEVKREKKNDFFFNWGRRPVSTRSRTHIS